MSDPIGLAEALEEEAPLGEPLERDERRLLAAALRLADTVDRAEKRRRKQVGFADHGLDRDEAEMLADYRKAREAR